MKIDISRIAKVDGASMDVSVSTVMEGLSDMANGFEFNDPVSFAGTLLNTGGVLKLEGSLTAEYSSKCDRCLKDIKGVMALPVKEDFLSSDKATDTETYIYEGNYVSIDKALKDNVVLNLPARQLCKEDCKGLCAVCGNDFNIGTCQCGSDDINPRMTALKDFFKV